MAAEAAALEGSKEHIYPGGTKTPFPWPEIVGEKLLAQHTYDWDTLKTLFWAKMASIELFSICGDYGNSFCIAFYNF